MERTWVYQISAVFNTLRMNGIIPGTAMSLELRLKSLLKDVLVAPPQMMTTVELCRISTNRLLTDVEIDEIKDREKLAALSHGPSTALIEIKVMIVDA